MKTIARNACGLACIVSLVALPTSPVAARSCGVLDPRAALKHADAAFIGTIIEEEPLPRPEGSSSSESETRYRFSVERVFKGDLDAEIEVTHGESYWDLGDRAAVLLYQGSEGWYWPYCSHVSFRQLRLAARPRPKPRPGPVAMVIGGSFGNTRLMALGEQGQPRGYATGGSTPDELSICPGADLMVELREEEDPPRYVHVLARELPSMRVVWERVFPKRQVAISDVLCPDASGTKAYLFVEGEKGSEPSSMYLVERADTRLLYRAQGELISLGTDRLVVARRARTRIAIHETDTGSLIRKVRVPPRTMSAAVSPDGSLLVGSTRKPSTDRPDGVFLQNLGTGGSTRQEPLPYEPDFDRWTEVIWVSSEMFAAVSEGRAPIVLYNRNLERVDTIEQAMGGISEAFDGTIYTLTWAGTLRRARPGYERTRVLRDLNSPVITAFDAAPPLPQPYPPPR